MDINSIADIARFLTDEAAAQQALRLDIASRLTHQSVANAQALKSLVKIYARAAGVSHLASSSQQKL